MERDVDDAEDDIPAADAGDAKLRHGDRVLDLTANAIGLISLVTSMAAPVLFKLNSASNWSLLSITYPGFLRSNASFTM
jgi:hypothetical protein